MDPRFVSDDSARGRSLEPLGYYHGFGAFGSTAQAAAVLRNANALVARALPPPVKAAIDATPITRAQKKMLKESPLSALVVAGDIAADKVIEFIKRVQAKARKPSSYTMGGHRIVIAPTKRQQPAELASQFLTVSYFNPVEAAIVAVEMQVQTGVAAVQVAGAVVGAEMGRAAKAASDAQKAAEQAAVQAGKTAQQVAQEGQKAFNTTMNTVTSWFGFKGFGQVVTEAAVAAGGTAAAAGGAVTAEGVLLSALSALISMAPMLVPMLIDLVKGAIPKPPNASQINAASQSATGGPGSLAAKNMPKNTIFGLSPVVAVGGVAVLLLGAAVLLKRK